MWLRCLFMFFLGTLFGVGLMIWFLVRAFKNKE